jgi:hypothetical protein
MSYSDGVCASGERLATHVGEQTGDLVLVDLVQLGPTPLTGVEDVFSEKLLWNFGGGDSCSTVVLLLRIVLVHSVFVCSGGLSLRAKCRGHHRVSAAVTVHNELRQALIFRGVNGVTNDTEDVETRQNRLGELDVLAERHSAVVATADGVGCSHDSATSLQSCDDTCLRDGDSLLFHCFVNGGSVLVVHLVELVNQTSTSVCENKRTTFQSPFSRKRISPDTSSETDSRGTLTSGEDSTVGCVFNVFEHLGLRSTRVTEKEDIDITSHGVLALCHLCNTTEERESDGSLDVFMSVDRGCNRFDELVHDLGVTAQGTNLSLVLLSQPETSQLVVALDNMVCLDDSGEDGEAILVVQLCIVAVAINTSNLDFLTRLGRVNQVPEQDDLTMSGQTTGRNRTWRFLERKFLVVSVDRLLAVNSERTARLAVLTEAQLDL